MDLKKKIPLICFWWTWAPSGVPKKLMNTQPEKNGTNILFTRVYIKVHFNIKYTLFKRNKIIS